VAIFTILYPDNYRYKVKFVCDAVLTSMSVCTECIFS